MGDLENLFITCDTQSQYVHQSNFFDDEKKAECRIIS